MTVLPTRNCNRCTCNIDICFAAADVLTDATTPVAMNPSSSSSDSAALDPDSVPRVTEILMVGLGGSDGGRPMLLAR